MQTLAQLQQALQSDDWSTARAASDELADRGGSDALAVLIPLLSSPSRLTRNAVALALRAIGDNAAREPLIRAIAGVQTRGDKGTLVRALEPLDCSDYLRFLFRVTLNEDFEAQNHALTILYEQKFWYTREDLTEMRSELERYTERQDRSPDTHLLITDLTALINDLQQLADDAA